MSGTRAIASIARASWACRRIAQGGISFEDTTDSYVGEREAPASARGRHDLLRASRYQAPPLQAPPVGPAGVVHVWTIEPSALRLIESCRR
jgi:hypothetical protein